MKKITNNFREILNSKVFLFLIAAILMFVISFDVDLLNVSLDATETWEVAKSFFSEDKYYSYVMYKGIYAFIPSIIDYVVSTLLNIPYFYFLKVFNAICFAYVSVYGIPFLVESIHKNKAIIVWQRYLLVLLLLVFEHNVNFCISVDMFSCTMFFMLCNSVIKAVRNNSLCWYNYLILGLLFGINMCLSGQFAISTVIILGAFLLNYSYQHLKKYGIKNIKKNISWGYAFVLIFVGYFMTKLPNQLYMEYVVWPAKNAGAWIPTGNEWIINGLTANLKIINYPESIPDYLSMGLLTESQLKIAEAGGTVFAYSDYFKLILKNPFVFIVRWAERLFLGMFNDPRNAMFIIVKYVNLHLVIMSAIIYGFYDQFKAHFKQYKDFISVEMAIYIGFLFSALVPTFGHVENRYFFTARCLVYGVFALSPYLNESVANIKSKIKSNGLNSVNYKFYGWMIFALLSLMIYYSIYQSAGL